MSTGMAMFLGFLLGIGFMSVLWWLEGRRPRITFGDPRDQEEKR